MSSAHNVSKQKEWRATILAGVILVQAFCALIFIGDVIRDIRLGDSLKDIHFYFEVLAATALLVGVVVLMLELRRLLERMKDMDTGLRMARGQMAEVTSEFFEAWRLTGAERDVAMLILKGFDNDEIAKLRQTAVGTVRAQTASIYTKSGAHGRAQFLSLFVEEMMAGELGTPK